MSEISYVSQSNFEYNQFALFAKKKKKTEKTPVSKKKCNKVHNINTKKKINVHYLKTKKQISLHYVIF